MSHTQFMEKKTEQKEVLTKDKINTQVQEKVLAEKSEKGYLLSERDATEYRNYKRQRKVEEIMSAMGKSSSSLLNAKDAQRVCERAVRLKQAAVKVTPSSLEQVATYLAGSKVKIDCIIGGSGETWAKVKAYETRMAIKRHAGELTVTLTPSLIANCRYGEIRRELKRIQKVAKQATVKVWADKSFPVATLARLGRICSEAGVKYFCIPYFEGCERLRFDLTNGCKLEVCGVETTSDFRKMIGAGTGRIVTEHIWDIYTEWMREVEKISFPVSTFAPVSVSVSVVQEEKKDVKTDDVAKEKEPKPTVALPSPTVATEKPSVGLPTVCSCVTAEKLAGSDLKFL